MKLTQLSTTTKLYLLTLLLIFGILFVNQSVFAQDEDKSTTSEKRLKIMERYLSWMETGEYGTFKNNLGNKTLQNFKTFLAKAVAEDTECLNPTSDVPNPTFVENIRNFFTGLLSGGQSPATQPAQQLSSCKEKIKNDYKMAKKYNRALKIIQIEEGQPNVCVKADLGVGTILKAKGFNPAKVPSVGSGQGDNPTRPSDGGKETGVSEPLRVYLCTGNDGKKKVRVVDDSGTRLRLAPEEATKSEFQVENLPPKGSVGILLGRLGIEIE